MDIAQGSRQACQGHPRSRPHRYGYTIGEDENEEGAAILILFRLPWRRDPGPRRVHGRHHPLHYPQRQGSRYGRPQTSQPRWKLTMYYSPRGRHPLPPRVRARGQETEISGSLCVESCKMREGGRKAGQRALAGVEDTDGASSSRITMRPAACSNRRYGYSAATG
jgi:hypothetical protein